MFEKSWQIKTHGTLSRVRPSCWEAGMGKHSRRNMTESGLFKHPLTEEGLPLGLAAIKFWTRDKFKGTNALKSKVNPTRVPIERKESIRWLENLRQSTALLNRPEHCVHIGDRESDIYELFCTAQQAGTHFVVRSCLDRLAGQDDHTIAEEMKKVAVKAVHRIEVRNQNEELLKARTDPKLLRLPRLPLSA